jgi:hypothetical protein
VCIHRSIEPIRRLATGEVKIVVTSFEPRAGPSFRKFFIDDLNGHPHVRSAYLANMGAQLVVRKSVPERAFQPMYAVSIAPKDISPDCYRNAESVGADSPQRPRGGVQQDQLT